MSNQMNLTAERLTPYSIDFSPPVHFISNQDIKVWAEKNIDTFSWLHNIDLIEDRSVLFSKVIANYKFLLEKCVQLISRIESNELRSRYAVDSNIIGELSSFSKECPIHAGSPEAAFISEMYLKEKESANDTKNPDQYPLTLAFLHLACERAIIHQAAITQVTASNAAEYADYKSKCEELSNDLKKMSDDSQQLKEKLITAEDELNNFKEAFKSSIIMSEPVQHWEDLTKNYKNKAYLCLAVVICVMIGAAYSIYTFGPGFITRYTDPLHAVGTSIALATLLFLLIRLLTKFYISNLHLSVDVCERAAMTKAYLALMQKMVPSDVERTVFFRAVFRPCTSGIVKEDGPQTPTDILCKLVENASKKTTP